MKEKEANSRSPSFFPGDRQQLQITLGSSKPNIKARKENTATIKPLLIPFKIAIPIK